LVGDLRFLISCSVFIRLHFVKVRVITTPAKPNVNSLHKTNHLQKQDNMKQIYTLLILITAFFLQSINIKGQSFDIVDPGPKLKNEKITFNLENATDGTTPLHGTYYITTTRIDPYLNLGLSIVSFINGSCQYTTRNPLDGYVGQIEVAITIDDGADLQVEKRTSLYVADILWEGTTDSDWTKTSNWSSGILPDDEKYIGIPSRTNNPEISNTSVTINNLAIGNGARITLSNNSELTIKQGGNLTIENGGVLTISPTGIMTASGTLTNEAGVNGLLIESGSSSTGSLIHNNSGVQATVQRYVAGNQWQLVSVPVTGQQIGEFLANASNDIFENKTHDYYAMTSYDEVAGTNGEWESYDSYTATNTNAFVAGQSYLLRRRTSGVVTFSGTLVPSLNLSVPNTNSGWNSIGNTFPSALKVRDTGGFIAENSGEFEPDYAALYIYDYTMDGLFNYRILNNSNPLDPGDKYIDQDYLQPGQGFLVKAKSGDGEFSFTNAMKSHQPGVQFYKKSSSNPWPTITLNVSNESKDASTIITFHENMTRGLDVTYDAGLFGGDPEFRLYTNLAEEDNGTKLAIQCLPDYGFEDMVIPLGFDFTTGGEVRFTTDVLVLPTGARAILEDRESGTFTDLEQDDYIVTLAPNSSGSGRFFLHTDYQVTSVEDIFDSGTDELKIYSYGKEIFISGEIGEGAFATLYDLMGRNIRKIKLENSSFNSFRVDGVASGIYIVRVTNEGKQKTSRVFIE
jgi:hypothetical protein